MKRSGCLRWLLILFCAFLLFIFFVIFLLRNFFASDFIRRSDAPVTSQEANAQLAFAFPPAATNVYYFYHSAGIQWLEFYLRFHVPPGGASAAVDSLIAKSSHHIASAKIPIPGADLPPGAVRWWNVPGIKHGFAVIAPGSYSPSIWYDSDASVIYFFETD